LPSVVLVLKLLIFHPSSSLLAAAASPFGSMSSVFMSPRKTIEREYSM